MFEVDAQTAIVTGAAKTESGSYRRLANAGAGVAIADIRQQRRRHSAKTCLPRTSGYYGCELCATGLTAWSIWMVFSLSVSASSARFDGVRRVVGG